MKQVKASLLFTLLLSISSCTLIQKIIFNPHQPYEMEREDVLKWSQSMNIPFNRNFIICPDYWYDYFLKKDSTASKWVRIFNHNGERIDYTSATSKESCPGNAESFIRVFSKQVDQIIFDKQFALSHEWPNWCSFEMNRTKDFVIPSADLHVVIYWGHFMSLKLQRMLIRDIQKEVALRHDLKIEVYYVNIDPIKNSANSYFERIAYEKELSKKNVQQN